MCNKALSLLCSHEVRHGMLAAAGTSVTCCKLFVVMLQATAAAQQRVTAEQEDPHGAKQSGFIKHLSSKAVPAWRQPLRGMQV